jgi:predicted Rdx family selenoprotein
VQVRSSSSSASSGVPRATLKALDSRLIKWALVTPAPRWLHRATWTQTELFLTFPPSVDASSDETPRAAPVASGLKSISLVPRNAPETGGRFRVWLLLGDSAAKEVQGPYPTANKGKEERWRGWELVWDRKIEGRFPEMKELVSFAPPYRQDRCAELTEEMLYPTARNNESGT